MNETKSPSSREAPVWEAEQRFKERASRLVPDHDGQSARGVGGSCVKRVIDMKGCIRLRVMDPVLLRTETRRWGSTLLEPRLDRSERAIGR